MGVPGLWDVLQEAGYPIALLKFAIQDGFDNNLSGLRGLRVGIDASIWFFHAENSTDAGSNPELRLLAFRCFRLLDAGVIPLFIFDGPERPDVKRGSRKGKRGLHWLHKDFTVMLECFGMEWRRAPGEAEAELAYLNRMNIIDAVITDDVDTFLFGGRTVIRNMSFALSGNKKNPAQNANGKDSIYHVRVFQADAIESNPNIGLKRGGMILFALLCGGDYDNNKGVRNLSPKFAHGLARLGFGDSLLTAYHQGPAYFKAFLPGWRQELNEELRTNKSGRLPGRKDVSLPPNFPDPNIFELYANPLTSARASLAGSDGLAMRDRGNPSLPRLAEFCEAKFDDWGGEKGILKRFASLFYKGVVKHLLRRAALEADEKERSKRIARGNNAKITGPLRPSPEESVGMPNSLVTLYLAPATVDRAAAAFVNRATPATPPTLPSKAPPLFTRINKTRQSVDTDKLLEYEVTVNPALFVELASSGFKGAPPALPSSQSTRPSGSKTLAERAATFDSTEEIKVFVPETMLLHVCPQLVADYQVEAAKPKTRSPRKTGKGKQPAKDGSDDEDGVSSLASSPVRPKQARSGKAEMSGRQAVSSPIRPVAKPLALPPPPQPSPKVVQPPLPSSQAMQRPPTAPTIPRTPPRQPEVKQERVPQPQRNSNPARPAPFAAHPPASHAHLPQLVAHAPPLINLPHFPAPLREFINVGLIETEEPYSDRTFIFTFTNPDDPDYVVMDDEERLNYMEVEDVAGGVVQQHAIPSVKHEPTAIRASAIEPRIQADPSSDNRPKSPAKSSRTAIPPPSEFVEELWEQIPGPSQPRYVAPTPAVAPAPVQTHTSVSAPAPARPPPAVIAAPAVASPARPTPAVGRKLPQPRFDALDDLDGPTAGSSNLGHLNHMFDQILGIVPGAQKRKRMTAAARKRAIAEAQAGGPQAPSTSQPAKRRRVGNAMAAIPEMQLPTIRNAPPPSPARVPSAPAQPSGRAQQSIPTSSSQPSGSRSVALFPDIPPLDFPSTSQPSRPTPRSRPVHRLEEIVVVSSDDEDVSLIQTMPRGNPPPTPSRNHNSMRPTPTSSRPQASQGQRGDFWAGIERFKDLS